MNAERPSLAETVAKTVVAHTLTYFFVGVLAFVTLEYSILYSDIPIRPWRPSCEKRPIRS
jgi:hypothetical protein